MERIEKTIFISYRRANLPWALCIYQDLVAHGYDVFFDYQSIDSGLFERAIIENIKARAHFLIILTPTALERCKDPNDWLRREIETAITENRNIVPLMAEGFEFGTPLVTEALTGKLSWLSKYNGLRIYSDYFFEGMQNLRQRFLNIALDNINLQPLSSEAQEITKTQKEAVSEIPKIETKQLVEADTKNRREEITKLIYETNIERYEQEKLKLAHEIHDSILNQLAVLRYKLSDVPLSSEFQVEYDELKRRLRELVSDLRPPILDIGISSALEELASSLRYKFKGSPEIVTTITKEGDWKYQENIEKNIYRIVQEACTNALVHARAQKIFVKFNFSKKKIDFLVEDDGIGFDFNPDVDLKKFLENKHYGIVGMFERAFLINAKIEILSKIDNGTRINLIWEVSQEAK